MDVTTPANRADFAFSVGPYRPDQLRVVRFSLREELSDLFQLTLEIASTEADLDFAEVVGKPALFTISLGTSRRYVQGMVSRFEQSERYGETLFGYRAVVVPQIWLLKRRQKCQIFQNTSIPDIIKKVILAANIPADQLRISANGNYPPRDYCVQYRETDFAFISRLMEQYGLFYFFEHDSEKHVMVIADDPSIHPQIADPASVRFREPGTSGVSDQEHVFSYHHHREISSGSVRLRDFFFKRVRVNLEAEAASDLDEELEVYDYPGEYETQTEGTELARVRLEEHLATRQVGAGQSDSGRFSAGMRFVLEEHPRSDFNQDYLLVRVSHHGSNVQVLAPERVSIEGESVYQNQFECIPSAVPFRPPRITPRPIIAGSQTAIVVGPSGDEIYTDEYGRVKVQFHWDRQGKNDEMSSCWVRVAQLWAGAGWGAMFIPRIGQEVIVEFLEGDPDQPIITGRVYNGDNMPPYPLPGEKTKSTIKSNSSSGGGGSNELRFEDAAGSEEIYLHGQKDWTIAIENDKNQTIGHDETLTVTNNRTKRVDVDQSETIGNNKTIEVGANHTEHIGADMSLTVDANQTESIKANQTVTIDADQTITVGGDRTESITGNLSQTVSSSKTESITVAKELTIGAAYSVKVVAAMNEFVGGIKAEEIVGAKTVFVGAASSETVIGSKSVDAASISESARGNISASAGGDVSQSADVNLSQRAGGDLSSTSEGKMSLRATGDFSISGEAKGAIEVADELVLKCGSASITLKSNGDIVVKGNKIGVEGDGDVGIKGSSVALN